MELPKNLTSGHEVQRCCSNLKEWKRELILSRPLSPTLLSLKVPAGHTLRSWKRRNLFEVGRKPRDGGRRNPMSGE